MSESSALAFNIAEACKVTGLGRTTIYELIGTGRLDARKSSGRTLILADSLRDYLANLPKADIRTGGKAAV